MTINIGSKANTETERLLSNFAHTPFVLHGQVYESVEGFWQSLKFNRIADRARVARLSGYEAKRAGRDAKEAQYFSYQNQTYEVGSVQHQALMKVALRAKLRGNPKVLKLLLETGNEPITHILYGKDGKPLPDSKTIPGEAFSRYLMELRAEYRRIHGTGEYLQI